MAPISSSLEVSDSVVLLKFLAPPKSEEETADVYEKGVPEVFVHLHSPVIGSWKFKLLDEPLVISALRKSEWTTGGVHRGACSTEVVGGLPSQGGELYSPVGSSGVAPSPISPGSKSAASPSKNSKCSSALGR